MKSTDNPSADLAKDAFSEARGSLIHRAVNATVAAESVSKQAPITLPMTGEVAQRMASNRVLTTWHDSAILDAYRVMKSRVLTTLRDKGVSLLGITSPRGGEGKSVTAVNLAVILAMDPECSVLLVDCDLRTPRLHSLLGVQRDAGLTDFLAQPKNAVIRQVSTEYSRLSLLPAGRAMENSSELLSSQRMKQLVQTLKTENPGRILIFDLPSTLGSPDVLAMLPMMEAVIMVTEENKSKAEDIRKAVEVLAGTNVIGTVLNKSMSALY